MAQIDCFGLLKETRDYRRGFGLRGLFVYALGSVCAWLERVLLRQLLYLVARERGADAATAAQLVREIETRPPNFAAAPPLFAAPRGSVAPTSVPSVRTRLDTAEERYANLPLNRQVDENSPLAGTLATSMQRRQRSLRYFNARRSDNIVEVVMEPLPKEEQKAEVPGKQPEVSEAEQAAARQALRKADFQLGATVQHLRLPEEALRRR